MFRPARILLIFMLLWLVMLPATSAENAESAGIDQEFHPVTLFEFHCWDPLRRSGQPERPSTRNLWSSANEETRKLFKLDLDPAVETWIKTDWQGHALVIMQFEQGIAEIGTRRPMKLLEQRCRIIHIGSQPPLSEIVRKARDLSGRRLRSRRNRRTERGAMELDSIPDWKQWCRAGVVARDDSTWRLGPGNGGSLNLTACLAPAPSDLFESLQYVRLRVLGQSGDDAPVNIMEVERIMRVDDLIELGQ